MRPFLIHFGNTLRGPLNAAIGDVGLHYVPLLLPLFLRGDARTTIIWVSALLSVTMLWLAPQPVSMPALAMHPASRAAAEWFALVIVGVARGLLPLLLMTWAAITTIEAWSSGLGRSLETFAWLWRGLDRWYGFEVAGTVLLVGASYVRLQVVRERGIERALTFFSLSVAAAFLPHVVRLLTGVGLFGLVVALPPRPLLPRFQPSHIRLPRIPWAVPSASGHPLGLGGLTLLRSTLLQGSYMAFIYGVTAFTYAPLQFTGQKRLALGWGVLSFAFASGCMFGILGVFSGQVPRLQYLIWQRLPVSPRAMLWWTHLGSLLPLIVAVGLTQLWFPREPSGALCLFVGVAAVGIALQHMQFTHDRIMRGLEPWVGLVPVVACIVLPEWIALMVDLGAALLVLRSGTSFDALDLRNGGPFARSQL